MARSDGIDDRPADSVADAPPERDTAAPLGDDGPGVRTLYCVDDGVPVETLDLIADACAERDVDCIVLDARRFEFDPDARAAPGDLVYRPAVSALAETVERHVIGPGVGTFYPTIDDAWFSCADPVGAFARAGVPVPRSVVCASTDPETVARYVDRLGGFPVVVKVGGSEGGVGVMLAESERQLVPLLDHLVHTGPAPRLSAFVPDAVHWRLVVVGDRVVASYPNEVLPGDFRSAPVDDDHGDPPDEAVAAALSATRTIRREHAGCDVLVHPSGRVYLLEANFPCYYPQAQELTGIDVAGAMVDHLLGVTAPEPPPR